MTEEVNLEFPRIIVEGPDGSGKSRLVSELLKLGDGKICTRAPRACTSDQGPIDELQQYVTRDLQSQHMTKRVYDRHPLISEPIYGPLIRGMIHPSFTDRRWLTTALADFYNLRPVLIYCMPPMVAVENNVKSSHNPDKSRHLKGVFEKHMAIYDLYTFRVAQDLANNARVIIWDYTRPNNFSAIKEVVEA